MISEKHGIPFLENNCKPETDECREHLEEIKSILDIIKQRHTSHSKIKETLQKNCVKMAILGAPYKFKGVIDINAFSMQIDDKPNRNIEINFKRNLIQWYKYMYKNYSRNGTIKY